MAKKIRTRLWQGIIKWATGAVPIRSGLSTINQAYLTANVNLKLMDRMRVCQYFTVLKGFSGLYFSVTITRDDRFRRVLYIYCFGSNSGHDGAFPLDLSTSPFLSLQRFIHTRVSTPLLTPSLLFPPSSD